MKIGVQWARGLTKVEIPDSSTVKDLIMAISKETTIDPKQLELFFDGKFEKRLEQYSIIKKIGIKSNTIIYMKVYGTLPEVKVAKEALPIDVTQHLIGDKSEEALSILKKAKEIGPRVVTGPMFEHMEKMKPRFFYQSESSCFAIRLGIEAFSVFQKVAFQSNFSTHRIMFLYGRLNKITGKVSVHCGMEPQQKNFSDHVEIMDDFDITIPLSIASAFGMQCVGMAISHPCNDPKHPVTEYMVKMAAGYQNMFSEYFTTVIVTPKMVDTVKSVELVAFQVNDAAMKIDQMGVFDSSYDPHLLKFNKPVKFEGKKITTIDTNIALCAVRVRSSHSHFPSHSFPSPSAYPSITDLKKHFENNEYSPDWMKLFDFNLLIFLGMNDILSIESIDDVVHEIINKSPIKGSLMEKIRRTIK